MELLSTKGVELELRGCDVVLAIRPYCHNDSYWQFYFDANEAILAYCEEKGYAAPDPVMVVRQS